MKLSNTCAIEINNTKFYSDAKKAVLNALSGKMEGEFWYAVVAIYEEQKPYDFISIIFSKDKPLGFATLNNKVEYQKYSNSARPKIIYGEHTEIELEDVYMYNDGLSWNFR